MFKLGERMSSERYLCPECGKKVYVKRIRRNYTREIRKEIIEYVAWEAVCSECGETVPVKEFDVDREIILAQIYCKGHGLVTIEEIERILNLYEADKRQLPFLMGVGEHTIERYLNGQLPNVNVSEMLKSFLEDYKAFEMQFEKNKNDSRVTDNTRKKVSFALERIKRLNLCRTKIEAVALYIINAGYEITNLALQKLLYYTNAVNLLKYSVPLFGDDCEAWVHGPVYPMIYEKFKCFGRETIYDCDLDKSYVKNISDEDKAIIDYVLKNFGIYNGKILERSTHRERPWLKMREGYFEKETCNEIISKELIIEYFRELEAEYDILNSTDVERYIREVV